MEKEIAEAVTVRERGNIKKSLSMLESLLVKAGKANDLLHSIKILQQLAVNHKLLFIFEGRDNNLSTMQVLCTDGLLAISRKDYTPLPGWQGDWAVFQYRLGDVSALSGDWMRAYHHYYLAHVTRLRKSNQFPEFASGLGLAEVQVNRQFFDWGLQLINSAMQKLNSDWAKYDQEHALVIKSGILLKKFTAFRVLRREQEAQDILFEADEVARQLKETFSNPHRAAEVELSMKAYGIRRR